jgi:hypothetical protein
MIDENDFDLLDCPQRSGNISPKSSLRSKWRRKNESGPGIILFQIRSKS